MRLIDVVYWTINGALWTLGALCLAVFLLLATGPKHERIFDPGFLVVWLFAWAGASIPHLDGWVP